MKGPNGALLAFAGLSAGLLCLALSCGHRDSDRAAALPESTAAVTVEQKSAFVAPPPAPSEDSSDRTASTEGQDGAEMPSSPHREPAPVQELPPDLVIGRSIEMPVPGDRDVRVAHAPGPQKHALVYLHGMCGDSKGAEPWLDHALARGTLIVVRADVPCGDRPGYKWPKEIDAIQARIDRALDLVKAERGGLLDDKVVTLIGYSQGAHRAEVLGAAHPERYQKLILGGPPSAPQVASFAPHQTIAVLGGELEDSAHMVGGARALESAGLRARFFLLPHAHHGDYGPEGHRVMGEVFSWLDGPSD